MIRTGEEREKETEEIFETIMTENFPKLISDTKTTGPGSSENTKQKIQKGKKKTQTYDTQDVSCSKSKINFRNPERSQRKK